jgi:hypothetical protein
MLMVTTTVRLEGGRKRSELLTWVWIDKRDWGGTHMVDGIHGNTTSLGPGVALDGELVLSARGLCRLKKSACDLI